MKNLFTNEKCGLIDPERLRKNIEAIADYDISNNNIFGSSYMVFQKGKTIFKKHYGHTDPQAKNKVCDNTIYRLASMTKPITAVAVLILADRCLISLDDPVSRFLPEFEDIHVVTLDGKDLGRAKNKVTIMHCLTHTSGFGSGKTMDLPDEDMETISGTVKFYFDAGLDFEPFEKEWYSPFAAFDILAAIVEKVSGCDFSQFLKKEIFEPLNMKDTTFWPDLEQEGRIISMHSKEEGKSCPGITYPGCVFERFPYGHKLAGAGLVSTLDDYSNFAGMLLAKGEFEGKRILSEQAIKKLSAPYKYVGNVNTTQSWGLGVRVITHKDYKLLPVGAFGWSGAYGTHFWVDPENEIYAVFMKNSRFDGGAGNDSALRFEKAVSDSFI